MAGIDDQRVIYLKHQENRGVNAARNTGSAAARSRYVIFLDSDDELASGALKPALAILDKTDASIGVALFACLMAQSGKPVTSFPDGRVLGEYEIVCEEGLRVGGDMICLYRREVLEQFSLPEQLRGCEQVFIFEISKKYLFLMVDEPLSIVHRQEDNLSGADSVIARSADIASSYEMLLKNHADILSRYPQARAKWQTRAMYRYGVAGSRRDVWRTYRRQSGVRQPYGRRLLTTGLMAFCMLGPAPFERWRINRLNRRLDFVQK
ncbi:MAG: glycosyltransferase family 2 protein [Thermoleophilia bacterium]|nr:glycosyltransferase family 2 protein [Thermoleophilia bacterium]